mmetsp:Transcript_21905/g.49561  ORF Transcript_21905/g.49561 Transcript_21905/m.49561 type:complete len:513 (-) Transcript_21905:18-1556(-)
MEATVSHRTCNEGDFTERQVSNNRRLARLAGTGVSLLALVVCVLLTADELSEHHAVRSDRNTLLQKLRPSAQLAPAALAAEELWKQTVGHFFKGQLHPPAPTTAKVRKERQHQDDEDDVQTALEEAYSPSEDHDPHGRLLPSAAAEQSRWDRQILSMQRAQLQDNSDIMRNIVLLHASKKSRRSEESKGERSQVKPPTAAAAAAAASAAAPTGGGAGRISFQKVDNRKLEAKARVEALAKVQGQGGDAAVAVKPKNAVVSHKHNALPTSPPAAGSKQEVVNDKGASPAKPTKQKLIAPAVKIKSTKSAPPAPSARVGSSDSDSRAFLSGFFDTLARRDEEKHVLHLSKYPRVRTVAQFLPARIAPPGPPRSELKQMETEVSWLRKRVEALQNALISEHKDLRIHEQKAEAKPPVKPVHNVSRPPAPEVKKSLPPARLLVMKSPPPLGCPIFPAPGEVLPAKCYESIPGSEELERTSSNKMSVKLSRCPDGSVRFQCPGKQESSYDSFCEYDC